MLPFHSIPFHYILLNKKKEPDTTRILSSEWWVLCCVVFFFALCSFSLSFHCIEKNTKAKGKPRDTTPVDCERVVGVGVNWGFWGSLLCSFI